MSPYTGYMNCTEIVCELRHGGEDEGNGRDHHHTHGGEGKDLGEGGGFRIFC